MLKVKFSEKMLMSIFLLVMKSPLIEPAKEAKKTLAKRSKVKEPPQIFPQEIKPEKIELYRNSDPTTLTNKEFNHWYDWWKDNFTSEDYLKYLSTQVYHTSFFFSIASSKLKRLIVC